MERDRLVSELDRVSQELAEKNSLSGNKKFTYDKRKRPPFDAHLNFYRHGVVFKKTVFVLHI